jgi:hypothetical protein
MGARYRRRCLEATYGDPMPTATRATLAAMGAHALDSPGRNAADPVGVYWLGHGLLALEIYGADTPTYRRKIRGHIAELELRKLIRIYDRNPGGRVAYQLLPQDSRG